MLNCPNCQSDRISKNGTNKSGTQQYRCKDCHKCFTGNPYGRPSLDSDRLVSIQLPKVLIQTLESIAAKRNLSVSKYLQDLLIKKFED